MLAVANLFTACSDDYENLFPAGTWEFVAVEGTDSLIVTLGNYPKSESFTPKFIGQALLISNLCS